MLNQKITEDDKEDYLDRMRKEFITGKQEIGKR